MSAQETPLRRQRKAWKEYIEAVRPEKHLCVGREKLITLPESGEPLETPLRRQRKARVESPHKNYVWKHLCVGREKLICS